jgi:predicted RNase H-like nuclease (RuvC/YqgF family)
MGKMIKPLVVVLLLLSITALVLGSMLYGKRELIKGRVQKLQNGMENVAKSIRYEEFNKKALIVQDKAQLPQMDKPLKDLALAGDLQYEDLQNTKADLARTEQELATTKDTLAQTEADLAATRQEVKTLEGELDVARTELNELRPMIAQLESDKEALQMTIDDQSTQITRLQEEKQDMADRVATLEKEVESLVAELQLDTGQIVPKGLSGNIIAVNPYWNFVVLDLGKEDGLIANTDMLVHRDDQLIGKVHVSNVKDDMAIAEIINDWEQGSIREGDNVLF